MTERRYKIVAERKRPNGVPYAHTDFEVRTNAETLGQVLLHQPVLDLLVYGESLHLSVTPLGPVGLSSNNIIEHIRDGSARPRSLWLILSDEHERDEYALKPQVWEGSGQYQVVDFNGESVLVKCPNGDPDGHLAFSYVEAERHESWCLNFGYFRSTCYCRLRVSRAD